MAVLASFIPLAGEASARFTGGIEGTVHDPVQAVVPGAEVIVINETGRHFAGSGKTVSQISPAAHSSGHAPSAGQPSNSLAILDSRRTRGGICP
jgi:hypothetical protein